MKVRFIIYVDVESLPEKLSTCRNNPKKSPTTKINKHTPSGVHCLHIFHLIQQKIRLIIIEAKLV